MMSSDQVSLSRKSAGNSQRACDFDKPRTSLEKHGLGHCSLLALTEQNRQIDAVLMLDEPMQQNFARSDAQYAIAADEPCPAQKSAGRHAVCSSSRRVGVHHRQDAVWRSSVVHINRKDRCGSPCCSHASPLTKLSRAQSRDLSAPHQIYESHRFGSVQMTCALFENCSVGREVSDVRGRKLTPEGARTQSGDMLAIQARPDSACVFRSHSADQSMFRVEKNCRHRAASADSQAKPASRQVVHSLRRGYACSSRQENGAPRNAILMCERAEHEHQRHTPDGLGSRDEACRAAAIALLCQKTLGSSTLEPVAETGQMTLRRGRQSMIFACGSLIARSRASLHQGKVAVAWMERGSVHHSRGGAHTFCANQRCRPMGKINPKMGGKHAYQRTSCMP
eukprot:TRINITY_DN60274_c0_g1_i1.p1 TRINITY_DN60274_c0_g1~~TRINITY_DN60274_c0_g1_i1.p1  ORF type:complete len:394 (+),score=40.65 TRINITY_DN60274_c0_g1_i1:65-1246(+)